MNEKNFESLFVNMSFKNKSIICGTIYRPPRRDISSFELFNENLYNIMQKLNKTKHKCFILGDFNFDLLHSSDQLTESFTANVLSFNYYPLINTRKPTKITENKHSAIDHIWTNITNTKISSGIITCSIADYLPIIQTSVIGELTYHEKNVMRCFTPKYLQKFKTSVEQIDFPPVLNKINPENLYKNFSNVLSAQFQNCFTQKWSKNRSNSSKCYDKKLLNLHFKTDKLYKKYMATGCPVLKLKYHKVKIHYFHLIN